MGTFGHELSKLSSHHTIEHVERTTTLFSANESNQQKTDRMVLDLQSQVTTLNKEWIETKEKYAAASVNNIFFFFCTVFSISEINL